MKILAERDEEVFIVIERSRHSELNRETRHHELAWIHVLHLAHSDHRLGERGRSYQLTRLFNDELLRSVADLKQHRPGRRGSRVRQRHALEGELRWTRLG